MATSPLPSRGPGNGCNCYVTLALSGVSGRGEKGKTSYFTPAFSSNPYVLGSCRKRGQNRKWLHHPCLLKNPKWAGIAASPLHSHESLEEGTKTEVATSPLPSRGARIAPNCYPIPMFLGFSRGGDKISIGHITPAFLVAQKWVKPLGHPSILRGSGKWDRIRSGYIIPALWGGQHWVKLLRNHSILKGPRRRRQIRSGYIIRAFSGAHKCVELLREPYVVGSPQRRD